jgi:hypothetical protein
MAYSPDDHILQDPPARLYCDDPVLAALVEANLMVEIAIDRYREARADLIERLAERRAAWQRLTGGAA